MKKISILLMCIVFTLVVYGNVTAATTLVVYVPGSSPCTTGSNYYSTIQSAANAAKGGDTVVVCPGTYTENVSLQYGWPKGLSLTIKSYTQDMQDPMNENKNAIVQAADPNKHVFYMGGGGAHGIMLFGFTITGATGGSAAAPCKMCTPQGSCFNDMQPYCAGIRVYCTENGWIGNNHIAGNNHGIIIRDSAADWAFLYTVLGNTIADNNVGVKLHYGNNSFVWGNNISDNDIGVHLIDTWDNEISYNTIGSNDISFKIERDIWDVNSNRFYNNDISNPVFEDNTDCLDLWYKRKKPTQNEENNCIGTPDVSGSNCSADYYCNPVP